MCSFRMRSSRRRWCGSRKRRHRVDHVVEFTYGGTLAQPAITKDIPAAVLRESPKWTHYPRASVGPRSKQSGLKLADLFKIQRGIATGANDFFILSPDQIAEQQSTA